MIIKAKDLKARVRLEDVLEAFDMEINRRIQAAVEGGHICCTYAVTVEVGGKSYNSSDYSSIVEYRLKRAGYTLIDIKNFDGVTRRFLYW